MTYHIDEKRRRVYIGNRDEYSLPFGTLERLSSMKLLDAYSESVPAERMELYAIARDELIERGLIEDKN